MKRMIALALLCFLSKAVYALESDTQSASSVEFSFEPLPDSLRAVVKTVFWKVLVYMAADNDLNPFALEDLKEMSQIGSNENLVIIVQFDGLGENAYTQRLLIHKGKIYEISVFEHKVDMGAAQSLTEFCLWAHSAYPSQHTALILWNHGSGVLDPARGRPFSAAQLFSFNPISNMLEIDRSITFFEYLQRRGVCFGDTYGTFLSNQRLEESLKNIVKGMGKKLDVIAFDACLMSMIEIADYVRGYADFMVGSEEVEPGTGWFYHLVLAPLAKRYMSPRDFAIHAVESYRKGYISKTRDFTQSAIDLQKSGLLISLFHRLSTVLLKASNSQLYGTVDIAISHAIDNTHCTHFAEPNYVDLGHFLRNLRLVIPYMQLQTGNSAVLTQLKQLIGDTLTMLNQVVIANAVGSNLKEASGLAIYYPQGYLSSSYELTHFYKENAWGTILNHLFS